MKEKRCPQAVQRVFVEFVPLSKAAEYGPEHAARPGVPAPADTKA